MHLPVTSLSGITRSAQVPSVPFHATRLDVKCSSPCLPCHRAGPRKRSSSPGCSQRAIAGAALAAVKGANVDSCKRRCPHLFFQSPRGSTSLCARCYESKLVFHLALSFFHTHILIPRNTGPPVCLSAVATGSYVRRHDISLSPLIRRRSPKHIFVSMSGSAQSSAP